VIGGDTDCKNIAAGNCPRTGCLTHCRAKGGLEAGRAENMVDAVKLAQGGKLTGFGCDAHEEKDRARKQRKAEQKRAYQEYKEMRRTKRNRTKSVEGEDGRDLKKARVDEVKPEEEAVNNV
jgi:tRNA-dihydrouridine synthase 1